MKNTETYDSLTNVSTRISRILQEVNNLTNVSSFRYSGLVHKKTLAITPAADKSGITVQYKKSKYQVNIGHDCVAGGFLFAHSKMMHSLTESS